MSSPSESHSPNRCDSNGGPGFSVTHTNQCVKSKPGDRGSSSSPSHSRGPTPTCGTPPLAPRITPVPLITPRYQKKSRTNRSMEVTDSFVDHVTPTEALRQYTTENMTIRNGPMEYTQPVHFHTYDVYRHGKRQIHSRSVGYSSEGDIVMTREDISEPSDVDMGFVRRITAISEPTVLDASARRPLTDSELTSKRKIHINRPRYKKYPGIYTPKNKKIRNRLLNDYFATEAARKILEEARERHQGGEYDDTPPLRPSFSDLPPAVLNAFDMKDDIQMQEFERLGIHGSGPTNYIQPPRDPDSGEARLQALNLRLRGELQHALNSEFLSSQIEDLEVTFSDLINRGPTEESLVYRFRDGYGRLLCHGVAAYYQLVSESQLALTPDGETKYTYVSFPKSKRQGVRDVNLPHVPLIQVLRGNRGNAPARHPLSASNTPQQRACPEPQLHPESGDLEPLSPLDLNENKDIYPIPAHMQQPPTEAPPQSPSVSSMISSPVYMNETIEFPAVRINTTVAMTINGTIMREDIPIYVPQLKMLTATVQGTGCTAECPIDSMHMTATQKKKLKKAAKAASQENTPVMKPIRR